MARIKFLAWVLSVIMLCSCTANEMVTTPEENRNMTVDKCYQKALSDAFDLMKNIYPEKHDRLVASKHLLRPEYYTTATLAEARPDLQQVRYTKSTSGSSALDTLLYIVNFGNDEGFAVMYADTTVPNNVIAITESGSLTIDDLTRDYNNMPAGVYAVTPGGTMAGLVGNAITNFKDGTKKNDGSDIWNPQHMPEYAYGEWENFGPTKEPLIKKKMHQNQPFNKYCPKISNKETPAGCVPIALIQIMSVNKYPSTINGYSGNWDDILSKTNNDDCPDVLSRWIHEIGKICRVDYDTASSGASTRNAKRCLSNFDRYKNVVIEESVHHQKIIQMILNNRPVYCDGVDKKSQKGHAWVLDGLYKQQADKYKILPDGKTIFEGKTTRELYHCNFGWGGSCDGYFIPDCFNLIEGAVKYSPDDIEGSKRDDRNYSYETTVILYDFQ